MSYFFPQGTKVFYSNTLASPRTVTAVTNASPAVATSVAHGYTDLDPVLFASAWADSNDTVFEVDQLTADSFSLLGLNATDTNVYPTGSGAGTTKKISSWIEIPQTLSISATGGGIKYGTIDPLGSRQSSKQPIGFEAAGLDIKIGYDPTNVVITGMQSLTRVFGKVAVKLLIPGGGRVYGYGNLACSEFPEIGAKDSPIQLSVGVGFDGRPISYGA
jgi:hypothetical protein